MKYLILCIFTFVITGLIACDSGPKSPRGFSLPDGSASEGKVVFLKYQCLACHQIKGLGQPADLLNNPDFSVIIGGKSTKVKTYADLLTSVINPSHKFARGYKLDTIQAEGISKMTIYNDVMTVAELVDLVTFLQSNYELIPYKRINYQSYGY
jgi:mono/diheme cytochrome c family protein